MGGWWWWFRRRVESVGRIFRIYEKRRRCWRIDRRSKFHRNLRMVVVVCSFDDRCWMVSDGSSSSSSSDRVRRCQISNTSNCPTTCHLSPESTNRSGFGTLVWHHHQQQQ